MPYYKQPGWFTNNVFNRVVAVMTRLGLSVYGSRILAVRGRKSGEWRTTPVNLLEYRGQRYLVAPRGVTQWVRNVRAGSQAELRLGPRRDRRSCRPGRLRYNSPLFHAIGLICRNAANGGRRSSRSSTK